MLDYSEDAKITRRAVDALAELMASKDSKLLEYQEADACLDKIYPAAAHSRSLIRNFNRRRHSEQRTPVGYIGLSQTCCAVCL